MLSLDDGLDVLAAPVRALGPAHVVLVDGAAGAPPLRVGCRTLAGGAAGGTRILRIVALVAGGAVLVLLGGGGGGGGAGFLVGGVPIESVLTM